MAAYRLEPIPTLPTLRICLGSRTAGFAYPPKRQGEPWEVTPPARSTGGLPDGDLGFVTRRFRVEADMLAFLGLEAAQ